MLYVGNGSDDVASTGMETVNLVPVLGRALDETHAPLMSVVVGADTDPGVLLEPLARASGGLVFDLAGTPTGQRELLHWLFAGLPSPQRIVKVEVEGAGAADLYYPEAWLPGRPLEILGRTSAIGQVRLKVTTARGSEQVTLAHEFPIDRRRDDVFLGRLWAQRKLAQLQSVTTGDPAAVKERHQKIIALSQEWTLLSPDTAFLVLESEAQYAQWQIDRQQRRRYWKPAETPLLEPLPADWVKLVTPPDMRNLRDAGRRAGDGRAHAAGPPVAGRRKRPRGMGLASPRTTMGTRGTGDEIGRTP